MRLLFRQRFFSWFDSYDIYDERENPVYTVKGQLSWGHCLKIFNRDDREVATEKEQTSKKKGSYEIKFRVKTKEDVYMFRVEVYPNGSVTINVTPVNKQAITFYGDVALDLK